MYIDLHVKYPLFLSDFNETWIFLEKVWKHPQISNFTKILQVGADLFHAGRRTDRHMTRLIVAFRNFANEPKKDRKMKMKMEAETASE
jgi:hypothetical protein